MLDNVRKYAMEKFAGDKTAVEQFVEGFIKEAMSNQNPSGSRGGKSPEEMRLMQQSHDLDQKKYDLDHRSKAGLGPLRAGFLSETGKGVGNLFLTLGIAGAGKIYSNINNGHLHTRFLSALEKAIQSNEIIRNADREKVLEYANTVFKFAPNVSTDVNVLTAVVSNAIHGEVIDTNIIKALTDLEGRYAENFSFSPKTYI